MLPVLWRLTVRAASAMALLALIAGIPAGLVGFIGWPLPDHLPNLQELHQFLTHGISDRTVVNGLAIALWLVWVLIISCTAVEAAASARGVQAPRLRLLGPIQNLTATLVAGLTAGIIAATSNPATGGILGPPTAAAVPSASATADLVLPSATADLVLPASPDRRIVLTAHTTTNTTTVQPSTAHTISADTIAAPATVGSVTLVINNCGFEHRVVKDESLWRIADLCLGDPHRWPEIWHLNQGRYWSHVSGHTTFHDPDLIYPGWVLELPHDATPPQGSTPITPPANPPTPAPTPSAPAPAANPSPATTSASPAPTTSSPAAQPSTAAAAVPSGLAASPSATDPALTGTPSAAHSVPPSASPAANPPWHRSPIGDGIHLPGGWITTGLGAALLAAVAMVWRRRRHRYIPTPITTPVLDDADLTPPLAALTRIRQGLRRTRLQHLPEPARSVTVREYNAAAVKPVLAPIGPSGTDLAGAGTLPLAAGLGLTGPGAHDAARALLVAVLSAGSPRDPDAQGRAIIPASTLATLIAVSAIELGPMSRLTVTSSLAEAITALEEEIIRRSRIIADAQVADIAALRSANAYAEPLPQLLLIADTPDPGWHQRLATAIGLGAKVEIGAALLGEWPPGTTLHVASDGTTTGGGDGQRLAVLDTDTAVDALTMLHEALSASPPITATIADHHVSGRIPAGVRDHPALVAPDQAATPTGIGAPVRVRILGTPAVLDIDGKRANKLREKSLELLVYLAVNRSGAPLDQIMEAIWPDVILKRATQRLSNNVTNLRNVLRAIWAENQPDNTDHDKIDPVINSGGHYRLDPAIIDVDWWTVLDAYAKSAKATDDTTRRSFLDAAIAAIGGPLAAQTDYEWADIDRERVRRHLIKIYTHAAALHAGDNPHQARLLLDAACDIDPLSEDLAGQAMRAAAALGDADSIRHRLDTLRQALDDADLDITDTIQDLATSLLHDLTRHHHQP
jgi:DNA-binding SARP family transcriptional activator